MYKCANTISHQENANLSPNEISLTIPSPEELKVKKTDDTKYWQEYGATRTLIHCWWMLQLLWKELAAFVQ